MQKVDKTVSHPEKRWARRAGATVKRERFEGRVRGDRTDARLAIGPFLEDRPGRRRLRWTIPAQRLETVAVA